MEQISREELFKIYVAIDMHLLDEARKRGGFSGYGLGASDISEVNSLLAEIIKDSETTFDEIETIIRNDFQGMGQIGFLKKLGNWIGTAAKNVASTVKTVVTKAAEAVKRVATLPARGVITAALNVFKGPVAKAFVYVFIPDDSPYLKSNPDVARKTSRAKGFIHKLRTAAAFKSGYLEKHIRNAIVKTYKKTPEEVIRDMANKKDPDLAGLGVVDWAAIGAAMAAIAPIIPSVVGLFKPKEDVPASTDWPTPPPSNLPVTIDPGYDASGFDFTEFIKSPLGIGVGITLAAGIGTAIYYANQ